MMEIWVRIDGNITPTLSIGITHFIDILISILLLSFSHLIAVCTFINIWPL